jgi:chromosome segregation ATPase
LEREKALGKNEIVTPPDQEIPEAVNAASKLIYLDISEMDEWLNQASRRISAACRSYSDRLGEEEALRFSKTSIELQDAKQQLSSLQKDNAELYERVKYEEARADGTGNRIAKERAEAHCKRISVERDELLKQRSLLQKENAGLNQSLEEWMTRHEEALSRAEKSEKELERTKHGPITYYKGKTASEWESELTALREDVKPLLAAIKNHNHLTGERWRVLEDFLSKHPEFK